MFCVLCNVTRGDGLVVMQFILVGCWQGLLSSIMVVVVIDYILSVVCLSLIVLTDGRSNRVAHYYI